MSCWGGGGLGGPSGGGGDGGWSPSGTGGGGWEQEESPFDSAVAEALGPIAKLEAGWPWHKMSGKFKEHLQRGTRGLDMDSMPVLELVERYTAQATASIFGWLSERPNTDWLGQADFLPLLEAGARHFLTRLSTELTDPAAVEGTIRQAHDHAYEAARFEVMAWEVVTGKVSHNKKVQTKVYNALEAGRNAAVRSTTDEESVDACPDTALERFAATWVQETFASLGSDAQPPSSLPANVWVALFRALVDAGSLPVQLMVAAGGRPPSPWAFMDAQVAAAHGGPLRTVAPATLAGAAGLAPQVPAAASGLAAGWGAARPASQAAWPQPPAALLRPSGPAVVPAPGAKRPRLGDGTPVAAGLQHPGNILEVPPPSSSFWQVAPASLT